MTSKLRSPVASSVASPGASLVVQLGPERAKSSLMPLMQNLGRRSAREMRTVSGRFYENPNRMNKASESLKVHFPGGVHLDGSVPGAGGSTHPEPGSSPQPRDLGQAAALQAQQRRRKHGRGTLRLPTSLLGDSGRRLMGVIPKQKCFYLPPTDALTGSFKN